MHFKEDYDHHEFLSESDKELQELVLKALQAPTKLTSDPKWTEFVAQKEREAAEAEKEKEKETCKWYQWWC